MKTIKITLQYDGTRYLGWQRQEREDKDRTIQGKLEAVLSKMTNEAVEVQGSGRTDAGVHALGQVAGCHLNTALSEEEIKQYLNTYLPEDIAAVKVEEAPERFHARLNAKAKRYRYRINNSAVSDILEHKFEFWVKEPLDVKAMQEASSHLVGTHDFLNFSSLKKSKKSTVRQLYAVEITTAGDKIFIDYYGNGFLYNMVRIMTGTLIEVGKGERSADSIPAIFSAPSREAAGFTAPPKGLFLMEVEY